MGWFDTATALFVLGLLYVIAPLLTWAVLARQRSRAVALWCSGGLLFAVATLLASLGRQMPDWSTIVLTVSLTSASCLLRIQALRLDLGRPLHWGLPAVIWAGMTAFTAVTHYVLEQYVLRSLVNAVLLCVLFGWMALTAHRIGRQEHSRNARVLGGVYGLVALGMALRALDIGLHPYGNPYPLAMSGSTTVLALTGFVSVVVGHFCYLGLALDRAHRREKRLVAEQAAQEAQRALHAQLAHLDRQRSIGEMSMTLAHEISQPVAAVLTNAQTGLRGIEQDKLGTEDLTMLLTQIETSARHASRIVERVRDFIKPSTTSMEVLDIGELVREVWGLVSSDLRRLGIQWHEQPAPDPVRVRGDALQLAQVLLNGLRNAIDAVSEGPQRDIAMAWGLEGDTAWVRIQDSGSGLSPDAQIRIMEPFYTTKTEGLGMGYAISRTIAQQHGGQLTLGNDAHNRLGGATLELRLPAVLTGAQA
ncbi:sensor histidine kinase [Acidovorax lacteus]|uniref:histidine kinase n=1 Tax=Acidovorax lacteus TaxID=1924988 RepID=A0ABP8L306_9BURK